MRTFHVQLIEENGDLLDRVRNHPLVARTASGKLAEGTFSWWTAQDFQMDRKFEQFLSRLAARAPRPMQRPMLETLLAIDGHVTTLLTLASEKGWDLPEQPMGFDYLASTDHLLATVSVRSFEEALAAFYAACLAQFEFWNQIRETHVKPNPWQSFIDLRSYPAFRQWVDLLASYVDSVVQTVSPDTHQRMRDTFPITIHYELCAWDSVLEGSGQDDR